VLCNKTALLTMKMETANSSKRCQPSTGSRFPEDSNLQFICGLLNDELRRSEYEADKSSAL
jgi:hypothetical protein